MASVPPQPPAPAPPLPPLPPAPPDPPELPEGGFPSAVAKGARASRAATQRRANESDDRPGQAMGNHTTRRTAGAQGSWSADLGVAVAPLGRRRAEAGPVRASWSMSTVPRRSGPQEAGLAGGAA